MDTGWRRFWKWAACGLWGLGIAAAATAAPPQNHGAILTRGTAHAEPAALSRLDLRAPSNFKTHSSSVDTPAFPSVRRAGDEAVRGRLEEDLPSLGSEVPAVRIMSRPEEMARRFRREGLPVARLFESRSALVSLGLNQRGKPGIWLIQKLP